MVSFGADSLIAGLAIIGIVIVVSALLSGLIDRSGLPQVAVFLGIGAALGPAGLGVFNLTLDSPILRVVATLSLTLVLFTDAVALNTSEVRRNAGLAFRMLGPGTILCAALTAVAALDLVRNRTGVRRDYESLYSLGVAFSAYAAAEAVHGSGFLAAFTAGLTIAALDVELCDCFIEYGGVTAEMLLLFTFVIFGSSLIWTGFVGLDSRTVIFAVFAMLVRVPVYLVSLLGSNVDRRGRLLIAWDGARRLSSLLLVLLPVVAGIPGTARVFALCPLIVRFS